MSRSTRSRSRTAKSCLAGDDQTEILLVAVLHFIADAEDPVSLWRPDSPADVPEDPSRYGNLVGVTQKTS